MTCRVKNYISLFPKAQLKEIIGAYPRIAPEEIKKIIERLDK